MNTKITLQDLENILCRVPSTIVMIKGLAASVVGDEMLEQRKAFQCSNAINTGVTKILVDLGFPMQFVVVVCTLGTKNTGNGTLVDPKRFWDITDDNCLRVLWSSEFMYAMITIRATDLLEVLGWPKEITFELDEYIAMKIATNQVKYKQPTLKSGRVIRTEAILLRRDRKFRDMGFGSKNGCVDEYGFPVFEVVDEMAMECKEIQYIPDDVQQMDDREGLRLAEEAAIAAAMQVVADEAEIAMAEMIASQAKIKLS